MNKKTEIGIGVLFAIIAIFSSVGYFVWTLVPDLQGREYLTKAPIAFTPEVIIDDTFIFQPMTNAQGLIRYLLLVAMYDKYNDHTLTKSDPLFDAAIDKMKQYLNQFPYFYDYFFLLARATDAQAELKNDPSFHKTAEEYYKKALTIAPGRQDVVYGYAINLLAQKRNDEALSMLRQMVVQYPMLPDNHYELGQALAVLGKPSYDESLANFEIALDKNVNINPPVTLQIYQKFFYHYYHNADFDRLHTSIKRLIQLDPSQAKTFQDVLTYMDTNHQIPLLTIVESSQ